MNIELIDLKRQHNTIKQQIESAVTEVLSSAKFIMGDQVKQFEKDFSIYGGTKHAISVANGTDALVLALKALGIGPGDEVITTPFTFFATAESISAVGAIPVFVDIRPDTYNINPELIEERITSKTKAIMPVHIFGQCADMNEINRIAEKYSLKVIEDACQASGAVYNGKKAGVLGHIACFSFFPTKNLGCAGDGGMIVTDDDDLATICRALRAHGSGENGRKAYNILNGIIETVEEEQSSDNTVYNPSKYYNYIIGNNSRLDEIQAAILRVKLPYLDIWNSKRRENAKVYNERLKQLSYLSIPYEEEETEHIYHMYILQSSNRAELVRYLNGAGIATGIYYPIPLHVQKAYANLGYREGSLPVAENLSTRTFAIPVFAELTEEERDYVVNTLVKFGEYIAN